jgi:hypothetical protein
MRASLIILDGNKEIAAHFENQSTAGDSGAIRIGTAGTKPSLVAGIYGALPSINNAVPVVIDSNGNLGSRLIVPCTLVDVLCF